MNKRRDVQASAARRVALDVLIAVREGDAYANLLLPTRLRRAGITGVDAGFATELCYGTLRLQGLYDEIIALAAQRRTSDIDAPVLDVLRLGCHQLLSMRVPRHAAVNESVALARSVASRGAAGFCNAILRTVAADDIDVWRNRIAGRFQGSSTSDAQLAVLFSHPRWIVRAFSRALAADGREGELESLLAADNAPPLVDLIALPGVAEKPAGAQPLPYSPLAFRTNGGDPGEVIAALGRGVRVQDQGSQLAALALTRARPVRSGERWLDLCAGPGGKAAILAAEASKGNAALVANELVPARVGLVRDALEPFAQSVDIWQGDGRLVGEEHPESFDRVLLDAPCTGLGALRRRPEARWRKQPSDVAELSALQGALIDSAIRALKPGGLLAYVTCSPHVAETRVAVADALDRFHDIHTLDTGEVMRAVVGADDSSIRGRQVQLWPHSHGTDAMFIALLEKRSEGGNAGAARV